MPAQAGIQSRDCHCWDSSNLDSRFRGNDGIREPIAGKYVAVMENGGIGNSAGRRNTIEEIHDSGFETILGTDDQETISLNQLLQDL